MNVLSFLLNNLALDKTTDALQKVATVDKHCIELSIYKLFESNTLIAKAFTSFVGPKLNILSIGDLSSWSTFILYTITIMLMFFAGGYYINVQQTDDLRWRDKNTYIGLPLALNGYFLIMLIMDILIFKTIFGTMLFGIVSIIVLIYKKITYTRLFLVNFSSYMLIDIIFFVLNDDSDMYIFIGLVFVMNLFINFLIMGSSKEKLYPLKEYLFYLVDEKCYSAKLESITDGFLVLHDVKLYNEEIAEESVDNLKVENFEIEKTIIPSKMIIPKEQVISMYILENKNNNVENNNKETKKIKKNSFILFLILINILMLLLGLFSNQYILKNSITITILALVILFSIISSFIKIKSTDFRREIEEFISNNKDSNYIDINKVIKGLLNIAFNVILIFLAILIKIFSIPKLFNFIFFINVFNIIYLIFEIKKFLIIFVKKIINYIKLKKSRIKNSIIILLVILLFVIPLYISF